MANIWQLDAGNSRIKLRVLETGQVTCLDTFNSEDAFISYLLEKAENIDEIQLACVWSEERKKKFIEIINKECCCKVRVAKVKKEFAGLKVAYRDETKLGVDRWLAMLASHAWYPSEVRLLVSLGTAITVDVVDKKGEHLGGYIIPGFRLLHESLTENTGQVRFTSNGLNDMTLGQSTTQAVNNGIRRLVVSMLKSLIADQSLQIDRVIFAGGDAEYVKALSLIDAEIKQDLIFEGLTLAFSKQD
ncbi:type III pantothenate kinase [Zooshikella marina]|uniref:type III pantothenate kinase n=1 Tax=Zooshikella ganghwensis TaxID=202772 RepID=UPI001BAFD053|nr:type III pantothenate kinase [Zooshikella ganghwensis]MBU2706559.1 type III pantothenate kinase [Zooshikella ganghwensis]